MRQGRVVQPRDVARRVQSAQECRQRTSEGNRVRTAIKVRSRQLGHTPTKEEASKVQRRSNSPNQRTSPSQNFNVPASPTKLKYINKNLFTKLKEQAKQFSSPNQKMMAMAQPYIQQTRDGDYLTKKRIIRKEINMKQVVHEF